MGWRSYRRGLSPSQRSTSPSITRDICSNVMPLIGGGAAAAAGVSGDLIQVRSASDLGNSSYQSRGKKIPARIDTLPRIKNALCQFICCDSARKKPATAFYLVNDYYPRIPGLRSSLAIAKSAAAARRQAVRCGMRAWRRVCFVPVDLAVILVTVLRGTAAL